jgi:hypothetical protein
LRDSLSAATLANVVLGVALLVWKYEGMICLLMAAPLAIPLGLLGGWAGHTLISIGRGKDRTPLTLTLVLVLTPGVMTVEKLWNRPVPLLKVVTAIEIAAPAERVWQYVVEFSELTPPHEWIFRAGVAYPISASIQGRGPGAVRRCEFSTGAFVEPIEVWDEPRLLKFSVVSNPEPMKELSPYGRIETPHLHGYMVSREGQFRLIPLPGKRTLLEGTTWYQHHLWPASYWRLWSDAIIHRIHVRVLRHVKALSEGTHVASFR